MVSAFRGAIDSIDNASSCVETLEEIGTLNSCAIQAAKGYFSTRYPQAKITPSFYYNGKQKKCVLLNYFDSILKSTVNDGWSKYAVDRTGKSNSGMPIVCLRVARYRGDFSCKGLGAHLALWWYKFDAILG